MKIISYLMISMLVFISFCAGADYKEIQSSISGSSVNVLFESYDYTSVDSVRFSCDNHDCTRIHISMKKSKEYSSQYLMDWVDMSYDEAHSKCSRNNALISSFGTLGRSILLRPVSATRGSFDTFEPRSLCGAALTLLIGGTVDIITLPFVPLGILSDIKDQIDAHSAFSEAIGFLLSVRDRDTRDSEGSTMNVPLETVKLIQRMFTKYPNI